MSRTKVDMSSNQDFVGGKARRESKTYLKCFAQLAYALSCHNKSL